MKRFGSILIILFFALFSFGQVPNGAFENWENLEVNIPSNWVVSGNNSKTADASDGSIAVRLDNIVDSEIQTGFIANVLVDSELKGGRPYADRPLTMKFDVKYDLASGDLSKVLAIFKSNGQSIGIVDFSLNGSSADTFESYSVAIQWALPASPDSIIVVVSSNDFDEENVNGDGYIIIDNIRFTSAGSPNADIENPSFENWEVFELAHPTGWYTSSMFVTEVFGVLDDIEAVVKSSSSISGSSVLLQNRELYNELIGGIGVTGEEFDDEFPPAFAVSQNWKFLEGYANFKQDQGDTGKCDIILYEEGDVVGYGTYSFESSSSDFEYFSIPISYTSTSVRADSATIIIMCSDLENPKGINTQLWVDNLKLVSSRLGIEEVNSTITIYPNPASDRLLISATRPVSEIQVYDIYGKAYEIEIHSNLINVSELQSGSYIVKFDVDNTTYTKPFIVK